MGITLTVIEGPHLGRKFSFAEHDIFLVGRSKRAHFQMGREDRYFSRIHFLVEVNPPHCRLLDMGSRNGTSVNGERVKSRNIQNGDHIKAGHTTLNVTVTEHDIEQEYYSVYDDVPDATELDAHRTIPSGQLHRRTMEAYGTQDISLPFASPEPRSVESVVAPPRAGAIGRSDLCPACGCATRADAVTPSTGPHAAVLNLLCPPCRIECGRQRQSIPGFLLIRRLGGGGMGIVYLAVRESDRLPLALKTIKPAVMAESEEQVQRFLREALILRDLDHPNIVAFHDTGHAAETLYVGMEYVRGTDAGKILKQEGPLPIGRAVGLACQLLGALEYAHDKGFVHRDIKPANLMVTRVADREVVKLTDFGLARRYQTSQMSGMSVQDDVGGTVPFMAPEQFTNFREAEPPTDQYAVGVTLYNLLTGHPAYDFPPEMGRWIPVIVDEEPVPIRSRRSDIPAELASAIHRMLEKDPDDRFPDVNSAVQTLLPFASQSAANS